MVPAGGGGGDGRVRAWRTCLSSSFSFWSSPWSTAALGAGVCCCSPPSLLSLDAEEGASGTAGTTTTTAASESSWQEIEGTLEEGEGDKEGEEGDVEMEAAGRLLESLSEGEADEDSRSTT